MATYISPQMPAAQFARRSWRGGLATVPSPSPRTAAACRCAAAQSPEAMQSPSAATRLGRRTMLAASALYLAATGRLGVCEAAEASGVSCEITLTPAAAASEAAPLLVRLRRDQGTPVLWGELEPFAMPGATKHKLHVHVYDNDDPDIPGIEVGHIHPEEFIADQPGAALGDNGEYALVFDFPHAGEYAVEVGYKLKGTSSPSKQTITLLYP
mmetsp:Transcript_46278/g.117157  ORF Transcript_46278/g.117157 Transcript_46278/m.117157 type:complete len:212 (+) Transcript_46278:242-877(+)